MKIEKQTIIQDNIILELPSIIIQHTNAVWYAYINEIRMVDYPTNSWYSTINLASLLTELRERQLITQKTMNDLLDKIK